MILFLPGPFFLSEKSTVKETEKKPSYKLENSKHENIPKFKFWPWFLASIEDIVGLVFAFIIVTFAVFGMYLVDKSGIIEPDKSHGRAEIKTLITKFNEGANIRFTLGLVKDKQDLISLRNSIQRELDINEDYPLVYLLEDYLRHITPDSKDKKGQGNLKEITPLYEQVKTMILEEQKESPFVSAPEEERRILISLKSSIKNNDQQTTDFYLAELSTVISTRNQMYLKMEATNRWSVPLAIAGVVFTIFFGITTILSLKKSKKIAKRSNSNQKL